MRTIVITGGARGIGAATVRRFAAQTHCRVYFLYEKSREAAEALARETGATALMADVSGGEAVRLALGQLPPVDVLVCNAGISHVGLISQIDEATWDRLFAVNVKGIYHCVNAVLPGMLARQSGSIVTVGSMWGQVGASCEACYSATKGAVLALTRALAQELGPSGIRVNCVSPGVVETDMLEGISRETLDELAAQTPLGRNGAADDVARAICYLADAPFITGQILPVNGGLVL